MADVFASGITVEFVCALCGKRVSCKTPKDRTVTLPRDWSEFKLDYAAKRFYSDSPDGLLVCSGEHEVAYRALMRGADDAAVAAFREHIRQGQAKARSAVDALGDSVRDE